ncbi:MAG: hypothetical protein QTN59_17345 [Candidatus Electrothrix communis]|nr:MAG: hypothetical protein QTN59_17345 [Candidatus Electrothrix communis]
MIGEDFRQEGAEKGTEKRAGICNLSVGKGGGEEDKQLTVDNQVSISKMFSTTPIPPVIGENPLNKMLNNNLHQYLITLLSLLLPVWIGIRIFEVRSKQKKIDAEYEKLRSSIWPFLHAINSTEGNLNAELLTHFPNHKNAAREYIEHLSGRRRKKFIRAWVEYEEQYDIVNSLGVMAPAVAIAPSEADLSKGPNAQEMIRWEIDRVDRVTESLNRLLDTARIKLLL